MDQEDKSFCLFVFTTGNTEKFSSLLESIAKTDRPDYANLTCIVMNYGRTNKQDEYNNIIKSFSEYFNIKCDYVYNFCENFACAANQAIKISKQNNFDKIIFSHDKCIVALDWLNILLDNSLKYNANIIFGPIYNMWPINTKKYLIPTLEASQRIYNVYIPFQLASPFNSVFDMKFFEGENAFTFSESKELEGFEESDLSLFITKNASIKIFAENAIAIHKFDNEDVKLKNILLKHFKFGIHQNLLTTKFTKAGLYLFCVSCVNFGYDLILLPFSLFATCGEFTKRLLHLVYLSGHILSFIKTNLFRIKNNNRHRSNKKVIDN